MSDKTDEPAEGDKTVSGETMRNLACDILDLAHKAGVPPAATAYVFGKVTKAMVQMAVEHGADEPAALMRFMNEFVVGMGMTPMPVEALERDDDAPVRTLQ